MVTVLESAPRVGGALQTTTLAGGVIDLGADGFLATRSEALDIVRDAGLGDELVPIAAAGASIYLRRRLHILPKGLVLGVPTHPRLVAHLGVSSRARRALWRDWLWPKKPQLEVHPTLGAILRGKFNDALVDELIEPMIGGIQAGRVDELSAEDIFPALVNAVRRGGSLQKAITPPPSTGEPGPVFYSLRDGLGSLPPRLAGILRDRGVTITTATTVTAIRSTPAGARRLEVDTAHAAYAADAVVVAAAGHVAARVLGAHRDDVRPLGEMTHAGAAMVTFAVPTEQLHLPPGTGVLIPLHTPSDRHDDSMLATAITFLDRKWPWYAHDGLSYIRVHAGRVDDTRALACDDEQLVTRLTDDLVQVLGHFPTPVARYVQRWPHALPQYFPGHAERVRAARVALDAEHIYLVGLAYDGVGVPATIGSARREARRLLRELAE
jgi:oxygen-dependent protoporphyrinogen oxidase